MFCDNDPVLIQTINVVSSVDSDTTMAIVHLDLPNDFDTVAECRIRFLVKLDTCYGST